MTERIQTFRFVVEVQERPGGAYTPYAVCAQEADAEYLAQTYRSHDRLKARVLDIGDHDD